MWDLASKAAELGIVASASGLCLTATPPAASGGPQLHAYGDGLAFLSNIDEVVASDCF